MQLICEHLLESNDSEYAKYFTGKGIEYALVCPSCRANPESIPLHLCEVDPERFAGIEAEGFWEWDEHAILGRPEVREQPAPLSFIHEEIALSGVIPGEVSAFQPVPAASDSRCLLLTTDGTLFQLDLLRGSCERLMSLAETGISLKPKYSLLVSPRGDMAAVVEARGREGAVLDLEAGRVSMRLDRGGYHPEQTEFPAAFFEYGGTLRLVHGTSWNRLDISDPRSGRLLTDRAPTSYRRGEDKPQHYLDYFHGELTISPSGAWVADNGWNWHPVGAVVAWSLRRWAEGNPWESEDGPTRRSLCVRNYYWGGPLCWIDDATLAVWGYGNDEENLIPAALLFDVESGRLVRWFAGPTAGSFVFDRHLFAHSKEEGMSVWDVAAGARLLHDPSFCPTAYHPGARQFVTVKGGGRLRLSRLVEA